MAEYTAVAVQTVSANNNVLFTATPVKGCPAISRREGSGLITLRGLTSTQCRARFRVYFNGNIAVPTGGTAGAIQLSLALDGETLPTSTMISTPSVVAAFDNVSSEVFIDVPKGCCVTVSVKNTTTQSISVQNANLIIERVA